jgi:iron complex outermembrane receptor protein
VLTSRVGNRPPNVPTRAANLWVTWDTTPAWQLRAGLRYVGARFWNNANTREAASYTVVDAAARRRITDTLALDLRLFNLFDQLYATTFGGNSVAPQWLLGPPRRAELSLTVGF